MKKNLLKAVILSVLIAGPILAQEPAKPEIKPAGPPDREKLSYASGMRIGMQLLQASTSVDPNVAVQAVKDVLEGKPTKMQESDIMAILNQARADGVLNQPAIDKEKFSYAGGMRLALQLKHTGADVDASTITQGIRDVLEGRRTKIQESEMEPLFMQAEAYNSANRSKKNKGEGDGFLVKNAKEPGVTVLPDGLQYRIIQPGAGETPTANDLIFIKYRGTFVNGVEFDHHDHFLTRITGGIKGWQEALQRMKVGSKWQIFVPSDLAFGHEGESFRHIGPDTTVIYELELVSIAGPGDQQISSGLGHGLDVSASAPAPAK